MAGTTSVASFTIIFVVALFFRAIFAFLETSLTALRLFRLKELARHYKQHAKLFDLLEHQPERILITILIASCISDVICAAAAPELAQQLFTQLGFSSNVGFTIGIIFATITILIFGEVVPKSLAHTLGSRAIAAMLPLAKLVYYLFYPLSIILIRLSNRISATFGAQKKNGAQWISSWKELQFLISYTHQKGLLDPSKAELLQGVFESARTPVFEIMTPIAEVVALPADSSLEQAHETFIQHPYTRIPAYKENIHYIIGLLHLKDLLKSSKKESKKDISQLLRPVMFVSGSMRAKELLRQFQQRRIHLAIVVNKQNQAIGLVTLEDTLEEIVGQISDEHE